MQMLASQESERHSRALLLFDLALTPATPKRNGFIAQPKASHQKLSETHATTLDKFKLFAWLNRTLTVQGRMQNPRKASRCLLHRPGPLGHQVPSSAGAQKRRSSCTLLLGTVAQLG